MKWWLCIIIVLATVSSSGQREHLTKGDAFYHQRLYREAIAEYQLALTEDVVVNKFYMTQQIARTYRELFDYENAELWYSKLIALGAENEAVNFLHYAQILVSNGKYQEAAQAYTNYLGKSEQLDKRDAYKALTDWPKAHQDTIWDMHISMTNIETGSRSMGVAHANGVLYYGVPVIQDFNERTAYYDLGKVALVDSVTASAPMKLTGTTNRSFYEGTPQLSADGKYLYYTANASEATKYRPGKKLKKGVALSPEGLNILKIYRAEWDGQGWTHVLELNVNDNGYSCAFPHVTRDGKHLYFASDKTGGLGGFDLYRASFINDSTWSEPVNLGAGINTDQDEMYPFTTDTAFYFASRGLPGYGGADIYQCVRNGIELGKAENIGQPINSSKDDFSFIVLPDEEGLLKGYLSSNRDGTHGYDHIYYFGQNPPPVYPDTIAGRTINKITLNPVSGVILRLERLDENGNKQLDTTFVTGKNGYIELILDKGVEFAVTFEMNGYHPVTIDVPAQDRKDVEGLFGRIPLEPIPVKNTIIKIPNIYFDFDKASIREESFQVLDNIVQYLNDNPDIRVELSAHTDARGSDYYNLRLSQRRAQSTVDYLVDKGIDKNRLKPIGYGEKKILNQCKNGVKCSDEEHEFNRRVELKVL